MICEIRTDDERTEVILRHITLSDVFAFIRLLFCKDKEICFTKPEDDSE